jgi:hypothetical protein
VRRALAILCLLLAGPVQGQDAELPARSQALLLFRVLGYDRHLARRAGEAVVIAVGWRPGDEGRRDEAVEALRAVALQYRVAGLPVQVVPVRWDAADWAQRLRGAGPSVLLVVGALQGSAAEVVAPLQALQIVSVASSRAAVEAGLAIGLVARGARAGVLINVAAARAAGADLDATLFTVAEALDGVR